MLESAHRKACGLFCCGSAGVGVVDQAWRLVLVGCRAQLFSRCAWLHHERGRRHNGLGAERAELRTGVFNEARLGAHQHTEGDELQPAN